MADMVVANAEYSAANGTYTESGTEGGKPLYIHESNSNYLISWYGGVAWVIYDSVDYMFVYGGEEDVATPDLCSDWQDGITQEPSALTVTAAGGSAQNLTLSCAAGSYSLTGSSVTPFAALKPATDYMLTDQYFGWFGFPVNYFPLEATSANVDYSLPCGNGSYILTGSPATINSARTFVLGMGSYVLVGTDAGLYILTITPACRTYFIDAENRTLLIGSEDRTHTIDAENRTMEVRCH